jgi:hypothetical protein
MISRFWKRLATEHEHDLEQYGFDLVKRVQALRYFTWRWTPRRLVGSNGRYLLRRTTPKDWVLAAVSPMTLRASEWEPVKWSRVDRWAYTVATRLLWQVALKEGDPAVLALDEPLLGAPFPIRWRGRLITQDLANTALEVASVRELLAGRSPRHVIEIGAGYGRTAHAILSLYPEASYTVVDIEPALQISRWYLKALFPDREIAHIDAAAGVPDLPPFDLAIAISSLHEMTHELVAAYLAALERAALPDAAIYVKQWESWLNPDDQITMRMTDYRLPGWHESFERRARVQRGFGEAGWLRSQERESSS